MSAAPAESAGQPQIDQAQCIDVVTVVCIAIVSYLLASVIHEGIGHGVPALLLGARGLRVSSAALYLDDASVSPAASRLISIAGPLTSLCAGVLLALYHSMTKSRNAELRYCVWLTAYVCFFQGAGYMMALSLVQFGDIHGFVHDLYGELAWRLALTVVGTILYGVTILVAGRTLDQFLGRTRCRARAARLLLPSYLAGSAALVLSTLLSAGASFLVLFSAIPATLGGTIGLPYATLLVGEAKPWTDPVPLSPRRSLAWYGAGVAAVLVYALVLGPGVPR
jgi:hypothetical protein